jgi:hypothetical protein
MLGSLRVVLLVVGLSLASSAAMAQRAEPAPVVIELPLQAVTALGDRPGFRAAPRRALGDALGRHHRGTMPLRPHFRTRVAASAGAL